MVAQAVLVKVLLHLGIGGGGERKAIDVGNLERGEVVGVQSSAEKPIVFSALILDLQPNRLNAFIVQIQVERLLALFRTQDRCGNPEGAVSLGLGPFHEGNLTQRLRVK